MLYYSSRFQDEKWYVTLVNDNGSTVCPEFGTFDDQIHADDAVYELNHELKQEGFYDNRHA